MSETLHSGERTGLRIDSYAGPETGGLSDPDQPWTSERTRYQLGTIDGRVFTLSAGEWLDLADYFRSASAL